LEVHDPQGTVVTLRVLDSGVARVKLDTGPPTFYYFLYLTIAMLASLVVHWALFRGGSTVHVEVPGHKPTKIRMPSRAAAAECMREVAEAVERNGLIVKGATSWIGDFG
jgi:hypothetical protein